MRTDNASRVRTLGPVIFGYRADMSIEAVAEEHKKVIGWNDRDKTYKKVPPLLNPKGEAISAASYFRNNQLMQASLEYCITILDNILISR